MKDGRPNSRVLKLIAVALSAGVVAAAVPFLVAGSAGEAERSSVASIRIDFAELPIGTLPKAFVAVPFVGNRNANFRISESSGRRMLIDNPANGGDVLYYTATKPMASIEESYAFVFSGPDSIVEPFIVNARPQNHDATEGITTNLDPSGPGNDFAGNVSYRYVDGVNQMQSTVLGRLRTEPYFYSIGHTYRVDAIADGASGLLTTRVYDAALGPQTFDLHIKKLTKGLYAFPGIIASHGRVGVTDFEFGPAGGPPKRPHSARRAETYINYLGYNAAVSGPTNSTASVAFQRYFPRLLIRHVRVPDELRFLPSLNAVAHYGIDADVLTGNKTTLEGLRNYIGGLALPPDSIELWNEPNNPYEGAAYDPQYASKLPSFAAEVVRNYPRTRIWGPSVLPDPNGYPSDVAKLAASIGTSIAAWNAHSYTQGTPENLGYGGFFSNACGNSRKEDCGWYGSPNYNDNLSAVMNPSLPGITSEGAASYGSYPDICGHSNVDLATQQAYIERGMLYNFKLGHLRIYPYKFIDDGGCSDGFGTYGILSKLVAADGAATFTPKPAYVALVNLNHILSDAGNTAKTFSPKPLVFALAGARPDVEDLLLEESDGSYRLVLWSDAALWDFDANGPHSAGSEVPLAPEHVDVTLAEAMEATVYSQIPGTGAWTAKGRVRSASIGVTVTQYPLVIAISAKAANALSNALPQGVPTPGLVETPLPRRSAQRASF